MRNGNLKRLLGVLTLLLLMASSPVIAQSEGFTIGFVPGISTNPFYIAMQHGASQATNELGVELIWQGAPEWDVAKQTAIVNSLVARQVDALILSPTDAEAMKAPLQQAVAAGIVVITTDTDINDPNAEVRLTNIASDNYQGGVVAGEALAEAIGHKGKVAIMSALQGVTTNEQRMQGFKDAVANYPDIEIVSTQYSNEDQATASQQMQSILIAHPDLAGAFAIDTPTSHGAALGKQAARASDLILVGFDAQPVEIEDVQQGLTNMLVAQAPYAMGYVGVQLAYDALNGFLKTFPGNFETGFYVINASNVDSAEAQKWVYQTEPPH